jgi:hypothetical protein
MDILKTSTSIDMLRNEGESESVATRLKLPLSESPHAKVHDSIDHDNCIVENVSIGDEDFHISSQLFDFSLNSTLDYAPRTVIANSSSSGNDTSVDGDRSGEQTFDDSNIIMSI